MPSAQHGVSLLSGFRCRKDKQWASDRAIILQALSGCLIETQQPTARLNVLKAADVARLTQEDWQKERDKILGACIKCHSPSSARKEFEKGDRMIKKADHLMAEAIRIVAGLYKDGTS